MAGIHKLTVTKVQSLITKGVYSDGGGLNLQVSKAGTKSWILRFMIDGKTRTMGLGSIQDLSLADAREESSYYRKIAKSGTDPIEYRKQAKRKNLLDVKYSKTFKECSGEYIKQQGISWKNKKHHQQWINTLKTYANPIIGDMDVKLIGVLEVRTILEPIWESKTETASRIRSRIERVLDWARVKGLREGENPARWRGTLSMFFQLQQS